MPKTWLSLAGAEVPDTYQGTVFLGPDTEPEPAHHFAYRGRADEALDMARAIRDKHHSYIKNYYPYIPNGQHLAYQWRILATQAWEQHFKEGKTNPVQSRYFLPRETEQFFDDKADWANINNLIDQAGHQQKIATLKQALRQQQIKYFDSGLLPEDMRNRRAAQHKLTLYELVRDPKLYPLELPGGRRHGACRGSREPPHFCQKPHRSRCRHALVGNQRPEESWVKSQVRTEANPPRCPARLLRKSAS